MYNNIILYTSRLLKSKFLALPDDQLIRVERGDVIAVYQSGGAQLSSTTKPFPYEYKTLEPPTDAFATRRTTG